MKTRCALALCLPLACLPAFPQTPKPSQQSPSSAAVRTQEDCATTRADLQADLDDSKTLVGKMQNRILAIRNAAGTVSDFEVRSALQANADMWQDLLATLTVRMQRMQDALDRCEARARIRAHERK